MPRKKEKPATGVQLVESSQPQEFAQPAYVPLKPDTLVAQVMLDLPTSDHGFFGTAKGTGKSTAIVLKCQQMAALQKQDFQCLITRSSFQALEEIKTLLLKHLPPTFPGTTYSGADNTFRVGGRDAPFGTIELAYTAQSPIEAQRSATRLQGRSKNVIIHDEVGAATSLSFFDTLMGTLRAPKGVPTQMIMLANPGGPAHSQLKARFWVPAGCPEPNRPTRFWSDEYQRHVVFVSATPDTNPHLDLNLYRRNCELMAGGDDDLLEALLYSNWGKDIGGAFFSSCWAPEKQRFAVKPGQVDIFKAGGFVAMDHGNAAPTVAYLCLPNPPGCPKKSLVLADEFYIAGLSLGGQRDWLKGSYMPNAEQARALLEWLEPWCEPHGHNPGQVKVLMDDAVFNSNGSSQGSVAGDFKKAGVRVQRAEKMQTKMASGLSVMRSMMAATKKDPDHPWLLWSTACQGWEATVPSLAKHPRDPDLLADGQPDHALDAARYGVTYFQRKYAVGKSSIRLW